MDLPLTLDHPTFTEDQWNQVRELSVKLLKNNEEVPAHLRIRESVRRFIKGKGDFYEDVARQIQTKMIEEAINDKMELTTEFISRGTRIEKVDGKRVSIAEGEMNENGDMWVRYFQAYYPPELFVILSPVGQLRRTWVDVTRKYGKTHDIPVAQVRQDWITNGEAANMIASFNLPIDKFLEKLPTTYRQHKKNR